MVCDRRREGARLREGGKGCACGKEASRRRISKEAAGICELWSRWRRAVTIGPRRRREEKAASEELRETAGVEEGGDRVEEGAAMVGPAVVGLGKAP